jgi:hypothetical protein
MATKYLFAICLLILADATANAADIPLSPKIPISKPAALPAGCLEWTDGCSVCARQPDGSSACSNVGIACLPRELRCTRP